MIPMDECGLNFVLQLMKNPAKKLNQENYPTGDRTGARCVRNNDVTSRPRWWSHRFGSEELPMSKEKLEI